MVSTKFIALSFLFLVTVTAGIVWWSLRDCGGVFERYYHKLFLGDPDFVAKDVRFMKQGAGTLGLPNRRLGGITFFRASDCVRVTAEDEDQGSPAQAADELEKRLRGAGRVIMQRPVRYGKLSGERVVLLAREGREAEIIFQYENDHSLHVIRSASLAHALAYEKLIQSGYRLDRDGYVVGQGN